MSELVGKLSQGVEYYKGDPGPKGDTGPRGEKGEPFRFEDFTPEQLESLKVKGDTGPAGEPGVKGDKGDAFTYADFTQEQLEALRGPQGQAGRDGKDGVSITHTWNGTSLSITSASGTSEMDLKGEKGDQGQIGPQGPQGPAGSDYVLTQNDKTEIANLVPTPDAFEIRFDDRTVGSALNNIQTTLDGIEYTDLFEGTNITKTNMKFQASYNVLEEKLYNDILNRGWNGFSVRVEIGGEDWGYGFGCSLDRMITTDEGGNELLTYQRTRFNEGFGVDKVEINLTKGLIIVVFTDSNKRVGDTATYFRMKFMEVNKFVKTIRAVSPLFREKRNDGETQTIGLNYGNGIINNNNTLEIDWNMINNTLNERLGAIQIPEEIKHITITDATELLNLENGFYIVDNEFTVNTVRDGEITFSGALSVKQDWQNYTFINSGAYLFYNNVDKTWDCSWSAWQEDVNNAINEAIANSGFRTEEQVLALINQQLGVIENGTY